MVKNLTKEQYWNLFQNLPSKIKTKIVSEQTAMEIFDICDKNDLDLNEISKISEFVGQTLLGVLSPKEFEQVLTQEITLKKTIIKKINEEIQEVIFSPIKEDLEKLYSIKLDIPEIRKSEPYDDKEVNEITKKKTPRKDSYRETVEEI